MMSSSLESEVGDRSIVHSDFKSTPRSIWAVLTGVILIGLILRVEAIPTGTFFRDDAWVALASKVPWLHISPILVSTPGITLFERFWIGIRPSSLLLAEAPSLLVGLVGIPAVFVMVRRFRFTRWIALTGALIVATNGTSIIFSAHIKSYVFDLIWSCGLLIFGEQLRGASTARDWWRFAVVATIATWWSVSLAVIVISVLIICGARLITTPAERKKAALPIGVLACSLTVEALVLRQHFNPAVRRYFWSYYLKLWPPEALLHSVLNTSGRLLSFLTLGRAGVPPVWFGLLGLGAMIFLIAVSWRRVPLAIGSLAVWVAGSAAHVVSIGAQRTDLFMLPVLVLLVASALEFLARKWKRIDSYVARSAILLFWVALMVQAIVATPAHVAEWTDGNFLSVVRLINSERQSGTLVVAKGYVSYEWAYYAAPGPVSIRPTKLLANGFVPVAPSGIVYDLGPHRFNENDLGRGVDQVIIVRFADDHHGARHADSLLVGCGFHRTGVVKRNSYLVSTWRRSYGSTCHSST